MLKWLKKIWSDLVNLEKWEFGCKYLAPFIAFSLTWGLIGHIYILQLDTEKLIPITGEVTSIQIKLEHGAKGNKYYPLKIELSNYPNDFRLIDKFKNYFTDIETTVHAGNIITLYKRNRFQSILSWGKHNDIYQIEKQGEVIFSIASVKKDAKKLIPFFLFGALIPWTIYILYKRGVIKKKKK